MINVNKILVVGPAWVGDMVMAQSLFRLLKYRDPDVVIDVLAPAWTFSLLSCMPEVSSAIALPITHGELKLGARYRLAKQLRAHQYTQAIVLQNSFKSALIPWLARIPIRTGWLGEYRFGLLNDIRHLDKKRYPLMIEQFMALGLPKGTPLPTPYLYPAFHVQKEHAIVIAEKLQLALSDRPVLAISAGAEFGPSKRWPLEYYAEIANHQLSQGFDVWLFGSPNDRPITDEIMVRTGHRCKNIAGRVALSESIALLSVASGLVTNDSGLMHVAAALNKPLIAIYGSTSPTFTPPLSEKATLLTLDLPCQPCFKRICPLVHHRCMRDLTPDRVLSLIQDWGVT